MLSPSVASADTRIGSIGEGAGQLAQESSGIAVSNREGGDIYVADTFPNNRVDQFEPDGTFVRAFGWGVRNGAAELQICTTTTGCRAGIEEGAGPGQLIGPDELAVDNDPASASYGDLYVVDQRNFRVEKFGPEGEFLIAFGGEVDKTTGANVCIASSGDICGAGVPGTSPSHFYTEEPPTEAGGFKTWFDAGSNSIAVGPDGTVYVGDFGRIQEFGPKGAFLGAFVLPVAAGEQPQFVIALAVDQAGDIYERSATLNQALELQTQVPGIREYSPARTLVNTFDAGPEEAGSQPTHLALDQSGDLFVADLGGGVFRFRAFKPAGALYAEFGSDQVTERRDASGNPVPGSAEAKGIAIGDAAGKLYATSSNPEGSHVAVHALPTPGPPIVSGEEVTDIHPTAATLHSVVDPDQFDTHYHFEYTTTNFAACGEPANPNCHKTTSEDLGSISRADRVQEAISALSPASSYRFRVVAESVRGGGETVVGPEVPFETLPDVSVRNFTTQTVGPELVTLKAELNPNNGGITEYTIRYGRDESYSGGSSQGTLTATGEEFEAISATFSGLQPNTTYHYQLIARNGNGEVKTADQTFTTELSSAEERAAESCPNTLLREENSSLALPDCRAYEQVSPVFKNGYPAIAPDELSPSGERATFASLGGFAGLTSAEGLGIDYAAHRTADGWITQPTGSIPASPGQQAEGIIGYSAELDAWLSQVNPGTAFGEATESKQGALYQHDADGPVFQASPTFNILEGPKEKDWYQPVAQSSDFSRLFIGTRERLLPAPADPRPTNPNLNGATVDRIYEVDGALSPPSLVAEVPTDLTGRHCQLDLSRGTLDSPWTSADGSTLFYTSPLDLVPGAECETSGEAPGPNKAALFARTDGAPPVQLSAESPTQCHSPSPCAGAAPALAVFDGISPDGSLAWFSTSQPLIDSDTESGNDLYLARLEAGQLSRLVQVSAGQVAPGHPTPGSGAEVLGAVDLSQDGTHIAYVARGVLTTDANGAGERAQAGAANLYVYDAASEETRFVAQISADPSLWRAEEPEKAVQFTPDGRYLLFQSAARLTADDTDAAPDIYRYDFQTGGLTRVSRGHDGNDADGNDSAFPALISVLRNGATGPINGRGERLDGYAFDGSRSISADGSVVLFETAAPLVSRDANTGEHPSCGEFTGQATHSNGCDVYEWEESGHGTCTQAGGCISLVSSGLDAGAPNALLSSSGNDILFTTPRGLAPADTDGVGDVYDARVGGGFHYTPPPEACKGAEACHGSSGSESPPPKITTAGETGGNGTKPKKCAKGKVSQKRHGHTRCVAKKHQKKTHHHKKHRRPAGHKHGGGK